jgi:hypothetical protein
MVGAVAPGAGGAAVPGRGDPGARPQAPKVMPSFLYISFTTLDTSGAQPLIRRKKVVLKNDYIHHVVDIYHI